MKKVAVCLFLFLLTGLVSAGDHSIKKVEHYLVKVEFKSADDLQKIINSNFNSFSKGAGFVLGEADLKSLKQFKDAGLTYSILDKDPQLHNYYIVWYRGEESLTRASQLIKSKGRVLYQENRMYLVEGNPKEIEELPGYQMSLQKLSQKPLVLELPSPEEAVYKAPAYSPVIANMINKVKTEDLLGLVKDLSGERSVTINGVPDSIPTRYTGTAGNYKAADFILEKFQQMGIETYPDTFYMPSSLVTSGIQAARDGQTAWTFSSLGMVLRTINGGLRWNSVPGTEGYRLKSIFRMTDDTLWGVGTQGLVVSSTDRGATWTEKTRPSSQDLSAVYFESSLNGWVAGGSGQVFYTSDGGSTWTAQGSGTSDQLYKITFSQADEGWIVGVSGKLLHTTNRGAIWNPVSLSTTNDLYDIKFVTPLKGWIVGGIGTVFHTEDGGTHWVSIDVGTTGDIEAVAFAPDDTLKGWMTVFVGKLVLCTQDGGTTWSKKKTSQGYFGIDFANSQTGWAVGGFSLAKSTDGGQTWTSQFDNIAVGDPYLNVVAVITGEVAPTQEFLITAHYDDISQIHDLYAPGADDNASGTVSVLTAASIMKDFRFMYTVKFVCFTAEEQGLIGSDKFAKKARAQGENIRGALNFDMISWDGNHDGHIEVHTDSNSLGLVNVLNNINTDYGLGFTNRTVIINTGWDYSDHASFWAYDYKSILGIEDDYDFNPYYHSTSDRVSAFDTTYFRKFCQLGLASIATLAAPYFDTRGDVNMDLQISVSDVVFLVNYLFKGGPAPTPSFLGDVDCSGAVEVSDVIYLVSFLFKGGPAPC